MPLARADYEALVAGARMRKYRELIAWQVAFDLARRIYVWTEQLPLEEMFGSKSQMRRAGISIASNLTEGAGRSTSKEFAHFVTMGLGSLNELETQALLAVDMKLLDPDQGVEQTMERWFGLLNGLRNALTAGDVSEHAERPTPNAERRARKAERTTPDAKRRTPNVQP